MSVNRLTLASERAIEAADLHFRSASWWLQRPLERLAP